jgi:hypothetical protein
LFKKQKKKLGESSASVFPCGRILILESVCVGIRIYVTKGKKPDHKRNYIQHTVVYNLSGKKER